MQTEPNKLIELDTATVMAASVLAVSKMKQPSTLQTPEIPYLQFILHGAMIPLIVSFETDEACEAAYAKVIEAIRTV